MFGIGREGQMEYEVAISFAGEDRGHASQLARKLRASGVRVFYDRDEESSLWGEDLYVHLADIYESKARFCVMLVSRHYVGKLWTRHERRAAQARAFRDNGAYILPLRLDDTEIPGLPDTIGYIDLRTTTMNHVVRLILDKLRADPNPALPPTRVRAAFRDSWRSRLTVVVAVLASMLLLSSSSPSPPPTSTQTVPMSAAASHKSYRLVFPVNNVLASEQSVERLHVIISFDGVPCAEVPPAVIYEISDVVVTEPSGTITQGAASAESGTATGFRVPVSGLINYGCGLNQVQLSFAPPGAILNRLTTTPIAIDVPREVGVTYRRMPDRGPVEARLEMPVIEALTEEQVVAFRVIAELSDANRIESCFLMTRSEASGPQDCDYELNGHPIFWRQVAVSEGEVRYER
jgi:hypothetical protein